MKQATKFWIEWGVTVTVMLSLFALFIVCLKASYAADERAVRTCREAVQLCAESRGAACGAVSDHCVDRKHDVGTAISAGP
jgi:hypothetical protein